MDIRDFRSEERNLLVTAFEGIGCDHLVVAQFRSAFLAYARLAWCSESASDPQKGVLNALKTAMMMSGWPASSWDKTDPLPEPQDSSAEFHGHLARAIERLPEFLIVTFFGHLRRDGRNPQDAPVVRDALIEVLQRYSWRASKGLSMGPDPW